LVGCVYSVLSLVLRAAQQGLHYPQQVLSAGEDIGGALLGAEEGGVSWQQLAGSRLERTIRLAEDEQQQQHVRAQVLASVTEPMRILHAHYMKLGHAAPNPHRTPPLLNEIWEPTSLAYRVLCY
jgi:hypothetical protein